MELGSGQIPKEMESQGARWSFLGVRRTGTSLSTPLRCHWMGLLMWAMSCTEQICRVLWLQSSRDDSCPFLRAEDQGRVWALEPDRPDLHPCSDTGQLCMIDFWKVIHLLQPL